MRDLTLKELEALEALIDVADLKTVLDSVAQIARLKACHISENWQDDGLARAWIKDAETIEKTLNKIRN